MTARVWLGLVALVVGACVGPVAKTPSSTVEASPESGPWQGVTSADGRWALGYRTRPWPVPLNAPFEVEVRVDDPDGEPTRLGILVDAGMPHHQHGMKRVPIHERTADGHVLAVGMLFHMPGRWTLSFDVTDGPITERAEVVLTVR